MVLELNYRRLTSTQKWVASVHGNAKKICRRRLLHFGAGAAAVPLASQLTLAEHRPAQPLPASNDRPLAERLADYASGLRYEDLDPETIERVKALVPRRANVCLVYSEPLSSYSAEDTMAVYDLSITDALLSTTRAVRKRLDFERPVSNDIIRECLQLAVQAPTGAN